jgi:sec-independent protein translocase protein TatA
MPNVGPMELIVILAIALIVLGPKKLPEVGKSLGKGMREFKNSIAGMAGNDDEDEERGTITASTSTTVADAPAETKVA